jgi:uncharacterized protein
MKKNTTVSEHAPSGGKSSAIVAVPDDALSAIDQQIEDVGGQYAEPEAYKGSIARTMFDTPSAEDGTVTVLIPKENMESLANQSFVRVRSVHDGRSYLGAVVRGPFAEPDGLKADAPVLVTATVRGGLLMPKYHGRVQVALISEELEDGTNVPPRRRPLPNSGVFVLDAEETTKVLNSTGDICLGTADGLEAVEVRFSSQNKTVLPRHLGILGTTGGGKSTTVSGLVAKLQAAGLAVVLLDTEGEYTMMNEPTADDRMKKALARRGLKPGGVPSTHLYHLVGRDTANKKHPHKHEFSLRFSDLSPYAVMEILDLPEAQQERFLKAYDAVKIALDRLKVFPKTDDDAKLILDTDELESGYPTMQLAHLYEMVRLIAATVEKTDLTAVGVMHNDFRGREGEIEAILKSLELPKFIASWRGLQGKLGRLHRLSIFDSRTAKPINFAEMLQPGRVSILDLSDTDSPQINNLVIAQILRGIQLQQDANYRAAGTTEAKKPTPTMVLIEEAHEFLSAERIRQMPVLFQQVARIAKRGRKRWLGLGFITQLPQHLPDEALGLINNWVLHKIGDANVIARLRKSIGGIDDALWGRLLSLAPGQAVVSLSGLVRPLQVAVDPTPCKLQMVD